MNTEESIRMIEKVADAKGASGFEYEAVDALRSCVSGYGEVKEDSLHNLYVRRAENAGRHPLMMLDAHTDEVSFMVKDIRPDGTLDFIVLGGMTAHDLPAHEVLVRTRSGRYIPGIISSVPPHYQTEAQRNAPLDPSQMRIDVGALSAEDAERNYGIRIGEPAVPAVATTYDPAHDLLIGKAFDCRLGCAAIVKTLDALHGRKDIPCDVTAAFSVQEEMGCRGAQVTAQTVKPDVAIVFEGCPADDTVVPDYAKQTRIGSGPMLRFIDKRMITNPRYQRFALDLAEELGIPCQSGVRAGGATNGAPIHLSNQGVPVIVIGIPVRYIHTHYGIAKYSDVENSVKLAVAVIERMTAELLASF